MNKRITFLIGLHSPRGRNDQATTKVRVALALDALSDAYDAFNVTRTMGVWEGVEEPSLRAEVILDDAHDNRSEQAYQVARTIAQDLDQDAVALTIEDVKLFVLVKPDRN